MPPLPPRDVSREYDYIPAATHGEFHLPPGLRRNLAFYARRRWVNFGQPIPLFEHLHRTFGRIAHYRFLGSIIIFINDPDFVQEILINQAGAFVRERTLKRMKILLGEGLITSDDPIHMRQRSTASASPPMPMKWFAPRARWQPPRATAKRSTSPTP
jgi:hypothetical protein